MRTNFHLRGSLDKAENYRNGSIVPFWNAPYSHIRKPSSELLHLLSDKRNMRSFHMDTHMKHVPIFLIIVPSSFWTLSFILYMLDQWLKRIQIFIKRMYIISELCMQFYAHLRTPSPFMVSFSGSSMKNSVFIFEYLDQTWHVVYLHLYSNLIIALILSSAFTFIIYALDFGSKSALTLWY